MAGVFLSYARKDGEAQAADLRNRLNAKRPDIVIQRGRDLLEGGVGWWNQTRTALPSRKG